MKLAKKEKEELENWNNINFIISFISSLIGVLIIAIGNPIITDTSTDKATLISCISLVLIYWFLLGLIFSILTFFCVPDRIKKIKAKKEKKHEM